MTQVNYNWKLKPRSINIVTGLAQKILNDAVFWRRLAANPFKGVRPLKLEEQSFKFWSDVEKVRFLNLCRNEDPYLTDFTEFALNTGLRLGEIEGLKRDCIDLDRGMITVRRSYCQKIGRMQEYTKSKRIRYVPINAAAQKILKSRALYAPDQKIFMQCFHRTMRQRFQRICRKAGVQVIRFHDTRHTFASHLAMRGVPIFTIKALLGHSDVQMTMRYAHLAPGHLQGVTDVLENSCATFVPREVFAG